MWQKSPKKCNIQVGHYYTWKVGEEMINAEQASRLSQIGGEDRRRRLEEASAAIETARQTKIREGFFSLICRAEVSVIRAAGEGEKRVVLDFIPLDECSEVVNPLEVIKPYDELAQKFIDAGYRVSLVSSEEIVDPGFPMYFVLEW